MSGPRINGAARRELQHILDTDIERQGVYLDRLRQFLSRALPAIDELRCDFCRERNFGADHYCGSCEAIRNEARRSPSEDRR